MLCSRKIAVNHPFFTKLSVTMMLSMFDLIQILNHLLLDVLTFINEKSKELCAYVIILHVIKNKNRSCTRILIL